MRRTNSELNHRILEALVMGCASITFLMGTLTLFLADENATDMTDVVLELIILAISAKMLNSPSHADSGMPVPWI